MDLPEQEEKVRSKVDAIRREPAAKHMFGLKQLCTEGLFFVLLVETVFSVPYRSFYLAFHSFALSWGAGLGFCGVVAISYAWRDRILAPLQRLASRVGEMQWGWFVIWWILGIAARLAWVAGSPAGFNSDGAVYFDIAKSLATCSLPGGLLASWIRAVSNPVLFGLRTSCLGEYLLRSAAVHSGLLDDLSAGRASTTRSVLADRHHVGSHLAGIHHDNGSQREGVASCAGHHRRPLPVSQGR